MRFRGDLLIFSGKFPGMNTGVFRNLFSAVILPSVPALRVTSPPPGVVKGTLVSRSRRSFARLSNSYCSGRQNLVQNNETILDTSGPFANSEMYANIQPEFPKHASLSAEVIPNITGVIEDNINNQAGKKAKYSFLCLKYVIYSDYIKI